MEKILRFIEQVNAVAWGPWMLMLLAGTGLFLTIGLRFIPQRKLFYGFKMLWQGRSSTEKGDISPFNALMTALSATIGTGNIAGVAPLFSMVGQELFSGCG